MYCCYSFMYKCTKNSPCFQLSKILFFTYIIQSKNGVYRGEPLHHRFPSLIQKNKAEQNKHTLK